MQILFVRFAFTYEHNKEWGKSWNQYSGVNKLNLFLSVVSKEYYLTLEHILFTTQYSSSFEMKDQKTNI